LILDLNDSQLAWKECLLVRASLDEYTSEALAAKAQPTRQIATRILKSENRYVHVSRTGSLEKNEGTIYTWGTRKNNNG
jgi:Holliday junction resolvasome RuvABC ATP-dependent DNA helicase subunit